MMYTRINEINTTVLGNTATMRVEQLVDKLMLKNNLRLIERLPEWIRDSAFWAKKMIEVQESGETTDALRLRFILNRLSPSLHHYRTLPAFRTSAEVYNARSQEVFLENTQATLTDGNGRVIQEGVHYTEEAFAMLMAKMDAMVKQDQLPTNLYLTVPMLDNAKPGHNGQDELISAAFKAVEEATSLPDNKEQVNHVVLEDSILAALNNCPELVSLHERAKENERGKALFFPAKIPVAIVSCAAADVDLPYLFSAEVVNRMGWDHTNAASGWWYARNLAPVAPIQMCYITSLRWTTNGSGGYAISDYTLSSNQFTLPSRKDVQTA